VRGHFLVLSRSTGPRAEIRLGQTNKTQTGSQPGCLPERSRSRSDWLKLAAALAGRRLVGFDVADGLGRATRLASAIRSVVRGDPARRLARRSASPFTFFLNGPATTRPALCSGKPYYTCRIRTAASYGGASSGELSRAAHPPRCHGSCPDQELRLSTKPFGRRHEPGSCIWS